VLAAIFSGKIKTWNDPELRALNRRSSLPNAPITIARRAEGSGTTFALTGFLAKASATGNWPTGVPAAGNEGVAKLVADTPYSLGYVEFIYAFDHRLSFASIANASGHFIQPDLASIAAKGVYPIGTYTWLVVREPLEAGKREAMMSFLECAAAKRLCRSRIAAGQARKLKSMSCRCVPSASSAFASRVYTPSLPNSQL
jgi:ABC-type phosphate transport system substrate-binding protein